LQGTGYDIISVNKPDFKKSDVPCIILEEWAKQQ